MEDWNELWSFEDTQAVQMAAAQTLKNCGISLPRGSEKINAASSRSKASAASFGVSLRSAQQPTVAYKYGEHGRFKVPRFLVEATQFLEEHSSFQGLFRKAGSVSRQKALRATLDSGNPSIPSDSNVHDVASLLKQYLRELPEPLITSHLLPVFEASYSLPTPTDRQRCILLACLLLPKVHLECLCVLMKLLHCVSESCSESLMDASNLAIVLAPNIIRPNISFITPAQGGNPLKNQTDFGVPRVRTNPTHGAQFHVSYTPLILGESGLMTCEYSKSFQWPDLAVPNHQPIVQLLIESAPWIGHVPSNVYAAKKPARVEIRGGALGNEARVEVVPTPAQNYKRVMESTQVGSHKKPEAQVPTPVINHNIIVAEESNGRNLHHNRQGNIVQNGLDSQNTVHRVQKVADGELKCQKLNDSAQKLPECAQKLAKSEGQKSQERAAKVQGLSENGLNVCKLQDKGAELQNSPDSLLELKTHQNHKSREIVPENGPVIQRSQDNVFRNRNYPTGMRREEKREEKRVEPSATVKILNEKEHPPSLTNKDKELITPNSWTGPLLFIGLIGLMVLMVAFMLPQVMYILW